MSSKSKAAKSPRRVYSVIEQLEGRMLYSGAQVPNSWTTVTAGLPNGDLAGVALLQPNGTVLVHGGGDGASANWYRLTPDATGGYVSGTWTQIPSMITPRLFFESAILPNDEMFVAGGEYTQVNGFTQEDDSPAAENLRSGNQQLAAGAVKSNGLRRRRPGGSVAGRKCAGRRYFDQWHRDF